MQGGAQQTSGGAATRRRLPTPRRALRVAEGVLGERALARTRRRLAARALHGEGLEIGALHRPLPVPARVRVRYVDRLDVAGLREHYPELCDEPLVDVEVIADGETLAAVPDSSQDFVIANHFLEHTEDPIGTLANHLRVLREGGVLYLAVPLKDRTFDAQRPVTTLAHLERDHREGPAWSRSAHYEEWARLVDRVGEQDVLRAARELEHRGYSIHFHVWDEPAFAGLVRALEGPLGLPLAARELRRNQHELIVVAEKRSPDRLAA